MAASRLEAHRLVMDLLRAGRVVRFAVTGGSMTPAIRDGDRVTVEPLNARPRLGDVVACESQGQLVVHRLVGWAGDRASVRGDVSAASDLPLAPGHLLGVVVGVDRAGRRLGPGSPAARRVLAWMSHRGLLRAAAVVCARVPRRLRRGLARASALGA